MRIRIIECVVVIENNVTHIHTKKIVQEMRFQLILLSCYLAQ